jgi:hypothetical protein
LSVCASLSRSAFVSLGGHAAKKDTSMPLHQVMSKG